MITLARSKRSLSSDEAKLMSKEMETLFETKYRDNLDFMRMLEMLLIQRIAEQTCNFNEDTPVYMMSTKVDIPLVGTLKVIPSVFHAVHGTTKQPSYHFEFEFEPSSSFKTDLIKAYTTKESDISYYFSDLYGKELKDLYNKMRGGE